MNPTTQAAVDQATKQLIKQAEDEECITCLGGGYVTDGIEDIVGRECPDCQGTGNRRGVVSNEESAVDPLETQPAETERKCPRCGDMYPVGFIHWCDTDPPMRPLTVEPAESAKGKRCKRCGAPISLYVGSEFVDSAAEDYCSDRCYESRHLLAVESAKPLKCPFCPKPENGIIGHTQVGDYVDDWWVRCCKCGAEGVHAASLEDAIWQWNRRAAQPPIAADEGEALNELKRLVLAESKCDDVLDALDGDWLSYNRLMEVVNQAWPTPQGYTQDPLELVARIIDERDEALGKLVSSGSVDPQSLSAEECCMPLNRARHGNQDDWEPSAERYAICSRAWMLAADSDEWPRPLAYVLADAQVFAAYYLMHGAKEGVK